ncbi:MAG TPA: PilZ domain-containing protein [Polyangiaceae bacterium]
MRAERRKHRRAPIPGLRVTYEDAAGRRAEADVLDIGAGGMFVRCDRTVPAGKGLTIELAGPGGGAKWSALGRVVWVRSEVSPEGPPGMGLRFVDAEQPMLTWIEELLASRERTDPGTGGTKTPAREPTVMGVGAPQAQEAPAAPIIAVAPMAREKTVLGMGAPEPSPPEPPVEAPMLDRSLPIELVATKPKRAPEPKPPEPTPKVEAPEPSEASLAAAGVPRRRGGIGWVLLLLLLAAGGSAYAFRARIPWVNAMIARVTNALAK